MLKINNLVKSIKEITLHYHVRYFFDNFLTPIEMHTFHSNTLAAYQLSVLIFIVSQC